MPTEPTPERLLDPDCRDGKHGSCVGDPCECTCHRAPERTPQDDTTPAKRPVYTVTERDRATKSEAELMAETMPYGDMTGCSCRMSGPIPDVDCPTHGYEASVPRDDTTAPVPADDHASDHVSSHGGEHGGPDLRARLSNALKAAAYVCPGDDCELTEQECQGEHPITLVAISKPPNGAPELTFIEGTTAAITSTVIAELVSLCDPGDLPQRMAEVIARNSCDHVKVEASCAECDAVAAMSVRWEAYAQQTAALAQMTARAAGAETLLDAALQDAQSDRAALQAKVAGYEKAIAWDASCVEHGRLLDAVRAAEEQRDVAEAQVAALREELAAVKAERDAKLRTKALGRSLVEMEGFAQRETARADQAEAERDDARTDLTTAQMQLADERAHSKRAYEKIADLEGERDGLHETVAAADADRDRLEAQVAALQQDLAEERRENANWREITATYNKASENWRKRAMPAERELTELKAGVAAAVRQIRAWQDPDSAEPLTDHVHVPEVERTLKVYIGEHVIAALENRTADPEEIRRLAQATTEETNDEH